MMVYDFKWRMPGLAQATDNNGLAVGLQVEDWSAKATPPRQTLMGRYCRVEPFDLDEHHEALYQAFIRDTDARNWTYLPYGPFNSVEDFRGWCQSVCTGDDPLFHSIVDAQSNQLAGLASYLRITPDIGSIEVGHIHFSPLMQRTRMATECMYLMMKRVFDELGYRRYEWKCNALNTPSCKAAERLGFTFEGIFRQAAISKNRNRDTAWFAIIDDEWPQLKAGYRLWLGAENFDANDQQIRSLSECFAIA